MAELRRRRDEAGYVAVLAAMLFGTVFVGMAAVGVDTAHWYQEAEKVQKAADAAALAGVTYMPHQFAKAQSAAIAVADKNGYPNSGRSTVLVEVGSRPSELKVTITMRVDNFFGGAIGVDDDYISRSATADYTAPAPMGSPCNTFGNEPPSQPTVSPAPATGQPVQPTGSALPATPFPNCSTSPNFWAAIEGPSTDKVQGDRYQTNTCSGTATGGATFECASGKNSEYRSDGYYWAVHVEPQAVGTPISVQIYDPAYIYTQITCASLYDTAALSNNMNDYATTDGKLRYARVSTTASARRYCSGDYIPGSSTVDPPTTTFLLRQQNDQQNPRQATPIAGCTKQFTGLSAPPSQAQLTKGNAAYNLQLAKIFHQWVELCSFTPAKAGDYYLQVRTNVTTTGGTAVPNPLPSGGTGARSSYVYTGNPAAELLAGNTTAGVGLNSFAFRAVPTDASKRPYVAMAGNESMPILQNDPSNSVTFNLIRALPGTRGQYIAFDFYDAADGSGSGGGTVKIIAPADATGSIKATSNIPNCRHAKNQAAYTTAANCTVSVSNSTHDGQVEHIVIPIPNDYNCNPATLGGCWFSVQITFSGSVTDFTTWTANIGGDPVRLIQ